MQQIGSIDPKKTFIQYTVEDSGNITTFTLSLEEIENEKLYATLHDSEKYTILANVINRELIIKQ